MLNRIIIMGKKEGDGRLGGVGVESGGRGRVRWRQKEVRL